jgi:hypothetical protein
VADACPPPSLDLRTATTQLDVGGQDDIASKGDGVGEVFHVLALDPKGRQLIDVWSTSGLNDPVLRVLLLSHEHIPCDSEQRASFPIGF